MVEETNIVTENQTIAAAAALNKLTETSNVTITNTTLKTVIEVRYSIQLHTNRTVLKGFQFFNGG